MRRVGVGFLELVVDVEHGWREHVAWDEGSKPPVVRQERRCADDGEQGVDVLVKNVNRGRREAVVCWWIMSLGSGCAC